MSKMIIVLQAYKEGKQIEVIHNGKWVLCTVPSFNFENYSYRVKTEPILKPLDYSDNLIGKVIIHEQSLSAINVIFPELLIIKKMKDGILAGDAHLISYQVLLENYIFINGDKCGKIN